MKTALTFEGPPSIFNGLSDLWIIKTAVTMAVATNGTTCGAASVSRCAAVRTQIPFVERAAVDMVAGRAVNDDEGETMNGSRYYEVRSEGTKYGIGFGSALAIAVSYTTNKSILWAIIHGILGWLYVIYFALFHS